MGELGYRKLDLDFWHMLLAPAGTPRPAIDRLNAALRHAMADARVKKTFEEGGMDPFPPGQETPEAAAALLRSGISGDVVVVRHSAASARRSTWWADGGERPTARGVVVAPPGGGGLCTGAPRPPRLGAAAVTSVIGAGHAMAMPV